MARRDREVHRSSAARLIDPAGAQIIRQPDAQRLHISQRGCAAQRYACVHEDTRLALYKSRGNRVRKSASAARAGSLFIFDACIVRALHEDVAPLLGRAALARDDSSLRRGALVIIHASDSQASAGTSGRFVGGLLSASCFSCESRRSGWSYLLGCIIGNNEDSGGLLYGGNRRDMMDNLYFRPRKFCELDKLGVVKVERNFEKEIFE